MFCSARLLPRVPFPWVPSPKGRLCGGDGCVEGGQEVMGPGSLGALRPDGVRYPPPTGDCMSSIFGDIADI